MYDDRYVNENYSRLDYDNIIIKSNVNYSHRYKNETKREQKDVNRYNLQFFLFNSNLNSTFWLLTILLTYLHDQIM